MAAEPRTTRLPSNKGMNRGPLGRIHNPTSMSDISDLNSLVAAIKRHTTAPGSLIGIEGHSTAGKTTLGTDLADVCGGAAIATDTYVDRDSKVGTYPGRIMLQKLGADLARQRA